MVMPELLHRDPSDCSFPTYVVGFGFPDGSVVKTHLPVQEMQDTWVRSLGWKDPPEEQMAAHSSILACFHGQSSLAGYGQWGCKESS